MKICCNSPQFTKDLPQVQGSVTLEVIQTEVLKRMKTLLGASKITAEAHLYNAKFDDDTQLFYVDMLMGNGVKFTSVWVRVPNDEINTDSFQ